MIPDMRLQAIADAWNEWRWAEAEYRIKDANEAHTKLADLLDALTEENNDDKGEARCST